MWYIEPAVKNVPAPTGGNAPAAGARQARQEARVRRYYAGNGRVFRIYELFNGAGGGPLPIHRRLWAPGVRTISDALRVTNLRIAEAARAFASCLDLGCGEGATLVELARAAPGLRLVGMTVSETQARTARRHLADHGVAAAVVTASYLDAAAYPELPAPRLMVAVESMNHAADAKRFLAAAAQYAAPGDCLIVVDDFLAHEEPGRDATTRKLIRVARDGWCIPSLQPYRLFISRALRAGWILEKDEDWTPWIRSGIGLEPAASVLLFRLGRLPLPTVLAGVAGGSSILLGYRAGVFSYRFLRFRRSPEVPARPS